MAAIEATRTICADPAGVALMLAGPTAADILADDSALSGAGVAVQTTPPRRTGIGFAATVRVLSEDRPIGAGSIAVQPASGEGSRVTVTLRLMAPVDAAALSRWLQAGLAELAAAAQERSYAA